MDLELHQLDLRYEQLRSRSPARERRLLASLAELGQQVPIVVVSAGADGGRHIVIDGYKRVRLLRRLGQDTVRATPWELVEAEALLLERTLRTGESDSALEQGWFLRELRDRFQLSGEELARRFDRTRSWVSRRLALVAELPEAVQKHVRSGALGAHAAMKYLVPLARANRSECEQLADAVAPLRVTTRQMAVLHAAWVDGNMKTRELILKDPALLLRARQAAERASGKPAQTPAQELLGDLGALGGVARRAYQRLRQGAAQKLLAPEREEVFYAFCQARNEVVRLLKRMEKELEDARSEHPGGRPTAA
jgi:ParB family transcriptional regulator, chromosome partitioning protein